MVRLVFVYGTLCDPELRAAVLGRVLAPPQVAAAVVPGHCAVLWPGRTYPGLVRRPGGIAEGLLLLGLSAADVERLDVYEGPEYRRVLLPAIVDGELHEAEAFVPVPPFAGDGAAWSLHHWQANHKRAALVALAEEAARRRFQATPAPVGGETQHRRRNRWNKPT